MSAVRKISDLRERKWRGLWVLSVIDECADVMEGERSSLVQENYVNALKEGSENVYSQQKKAVGVG